MPRRAAASATPTTPTPLTDSTHNQQLDDPFAPQVSLLRRQWKWAAFSQFFYTFATLFALHDVSLTDIEDDLTRSTSIVIHRVIHRLLVTATQDRKLSLENWQTALRKQYKKRDPDLNPIGPEPVVQLPTSAPGSPASDDDDEDKADMGDASPRDSSNEVNPDGVKVESMCTATTPEPEPQEESKDWLTLPMLTKLDSLHLLTEWQFHNVNRFRTIMKDEDETAQWRVEPIGYDSKANAYWLIGPDRLWIQRTIPKPPRNLKRKRAPRRPKPKPEAAFTDDESDPPPTPKKPKAAGTIRIPPASSSTPTRATRQRRPPSSPDDLGPVASRGPRAAKMQASAKLSAQAKELAELQRQAAAGGPPIKQTCRVTVTISESQSTTSFGHAYECASARCKPNRRRVAGDPERSGLIDGVEENDGASANLDPEPDLDADMDIQLAKTGLESDDDAVSELTELSEITPPATVIVTRPKSRQSSKKSSGNRKKPSYSKVQTLTIDASEDEIEPEWRPPDDFIEWETICVTVYEWEHICERFEGATHYAEKALYKLLSQQIVPAITTELREIQRKRHLEEAVSQRKRSSRLAVKENEKEEARLAAVKKAEEEEKLSRARRLEARQKREEEERLKREAAREKRRLDREERERKGAEQQSNPSSLVDVVGDDSYNTPAKPPKGKPGRPKMKVVAQANSSTSASGSRTPVGEDWVLDCDICHRTGVNKDDGSPLLCCGKCSKWQHIACHDLADRQAGRPKRDWDREEFICRACQDRGVANGKQVLNGSASYDAGRTPNSYHQPYSGHVPYGSACPPHPPRSSSAYHTAITFTHYQPQQHGFSSAHALHAQSMIPTAATTAATYTQPHYGSPPKPAQYPTLQASACNSLDEPHGPNLTNYQAVPSSPVFEWHQLALADPSRTVGCEPQCALADCLRDVIVYPGRFDVGCVSSRGTEWQHECAVAAVEGKSLLGSRWWRLVLFSERAAPTTST
ncbi:hypothetical protein EDB92DRAFT_1972371 [Lactarius akahatsu]|uniref:PHD-type domain-containing protein n=1 Tax=Lactarius akahatsu TaxID=416441 RepID=A0AAD4LKX1_9AGAM|nr:hypothetical protein EDB92DRAFT_1972371 [Lactarius akahatsu]